ncbi:hypothetical protein HCN51_27455 [Nonomuraea sp. FMUSA5-5]|uniref:Exo-alpha-sialidase n=1 Tax=Nonomuraea composti TaxID=2720023 RepID=A0ABX1BBL9_9ACTN|nr:hypothetical protein [Nonomuraea sp. FMUSA5-5]NJP93139.1 hypothetical protein [Nonomuraea sp. FMUSA5-5]
MLASAAASPAAADSTDIDRPIIVETVSGTSPLPAGCGAPPADGYTLNPNIEVLPSLARDPNRPQHLVTIYQQDRWNRYGSNGAMTAVSDDYGQTWQEPVTLQRNDDPNVFNDRPTVTAARTTPASSTYRPTAASSAPSS